MTKIKEASLVGVLLIALILFMIFIASVVSDKKETANQPMNGWDNLCYWKTIHPGEGITENGPGEFEYTLIMTANGIDVYLPCNGTKK